jgi:hypothetical protein
VIAVAYLRRHGMDALEKDGWVPCCYIIVPSRSRAWVILFHILDGNSGILYAWRGRIGISCPQMPVAW